MKLVSVIVPVYNVENYLEECIVSIVVQSYSNFELLLVDDGSTDSSGDICEMLKRKYSDIDIFVYHKENGGLSDARNYGIDRANGSYITFVDSDDYIKPDYIEELVESLEKNEADMSVCGLSLLKNGILIATNDARGKDLFNRENAVKMALKNRIRQSAWGKMYRREVFKSIRFPKGLLYEDLAVFFDILLQCDRIAVFDSPLYIYRIRNESIMRSEFSEKQFCEVRIIEEAMEKVEEYYPYMRVEIIERKLYSYFIVLNRILKSKNKERFKEHRRLLKRKIIKIVRPVLFSPQASVRIKVKIVSYLLGENIYYALQMCADKKNPECN